MYRYKKRSEFPALCDENASERDVLQDQYDFLCDLWEAPTMSGPDLFGCLCFRRKGTTKMVQKFTVLKRQELRFDRLLQRYDRQRWDQYFSPNIYARPSRKLGGVHLTRLGWCDVDEADPFAFEPKPSAIWRTSPGRTQALWFWDRLHSPAQASAFSKALTYRHGGDKGGSAANKLLRLPGSYNHKPGYRKPFIPLVHFDLRPISARPPLLAGQERSCRASAKQLDMNPHADDPMSVLKKYRSKLDASTRSLIRHRQVLASDRSSRVFAMVAGLHEAGATLDEIASVIWKSPYFREKHGEDQKALETEVSRIIAKVEAQQ
ncbi:RepB family DNA primase [Aliiroseovarius crassostreae]|uniref:RepB family DNA primase n=1 Tax=Aliiroseovarius crassostreae TaxID=154981 RepID=UPI00220FF563|nr:RepB family DNA primase [Aliiroseovarius crassostreae]UWP97675.1 RepB family DNA primase [Aliiroseovarius crassostreae]